MNRTPPHPQTSITISLDTYTMLCTASSDSGYQKEIWEIAAEAIRDWLARNAPDSFGMPKSSGVQWKDVFPARWNGSSHHIPRKKFSLHRRR